MSLTQDWARARRVAGFFRPYRSRTLSALGLTLAISVVNALEPLVLKDLFDRLGGGAPRERLAAGLLVLAGLALARELFTALASTLTWRTRLAVHLRILEQTVDRLHRLSLGFHRSESAGALMTRLDRGIQGVVTAAGELAFGVVPALVFLVFAVVAMLQLDPRLALLVLVLAPLPPILSAIAARRQTEREKTLLERWVRIYSRFNEVLVGIATVKSFAQEDAERTRFLADVAAANRLVVSGVRYDATVQAGQNLAVAGTRIAALALGGLIVLRGEATLGTLVAFLGYLTALFAPVQGLGTLYKTLRTASVSLDTLDAILEVHDPLQDRPDAVEPPRLRGAVDFSGVSFGYQPGRPPILDRIDVHVAAGEMVALVGPSGSGKSTLMALLQRFYDPTEGHVYVDGIDVRTLKQASLRRQIGIVLQEPLLFDDTLSHNIAYGCPRADAGAIVAAAEAARAHDFIVRLPDGYETKVGERGGRLSAGERQRVAIARALLKDPPILILDEATSALDTETEALVQDALERLMRGRTTFVVAHRLATVVRADRVLVLKDGRILESGSHGELLAAGGYYASIVRRQAESLLLESPPILATAPR
jgi:ATP-binding cassette, subfamily B, bacterial